MEEHNVIGLKGIIPQHRQNVEDLKLTVKMDDELYLRKHPELSYLLSIFMRKVLIEKPENPIEFAGEFFDWPDLKTMVEREVQNMQNAFEEDKHLRDSQQSGMSLS